MIEAACIVQNNQQADPFKMAANVTSLVLIIKCSRLCLYSCRLFIIFLVTASGLSIPLITKGFTNMFFLARTFGAGANPMHHHFRIRLIDPGFDSGLNM